VKEAVGYPPTTFPKLADNVASVNQQVPVGVTVTFNEHAADVSLSFHKPTIIWFISETELSGKVNNLGWLHMVKEIKVTVNVGG